MPVNGYTTVHSHVYTYSFDMGLTKNDYSDESHNESLQSTITITTTKIVLCMFAVFIFLLITYGNDSAINRRVRRDPRFIFACPNCLTLISSLGI